MNLLDLCGDALSTYVCEPLLNADRLVHAAERAQDLLVSTVALTVVCALSPPAAEFRLLATRRRSQTPPSAAAQPFIGQWLAGAAAADWPRLSIELHERANPRLETAGIHLWARVHPASDLASALTALRGHGLLSEPRAELVQRCLSALPSAGRAVRISAFSSETGIAVTLPRAAFAAYIQSACGEAWLERAEALDPWLDARIYAGPVECQLWLREDRCESVGIGYSQRQVRAGRDDASRALVRGQLVREGLCNLAQDAALAAWTRVRDDPEARVRRWLDVEVRLTQSRLTSSAYLGFAERELV